jgi:hypothetical protein
VAFRYRFDPDRSAVLLTFTGSVSGDELARATRAIYADDGWRFGLDAIWDFTRITELVLEWEDLQRLVDLDREHADVAGPGHDVLVVARSLDEVIGEAYTYLSRSGPRQSSLCHSIAEAWAVLGRGEPPSDRP